MTNQKWVDMATQFTVAGSGAPGSVESYPIRIDRTDGPHGQKWAIRQLGNCLNHSGEWEYEPQPSSRAEAFLRRCRWESKEGALETVEWLRSKRKA